MMTVFVVAMSAIVTVMMPCVIVRSTRAIMGVVPTVISAIAGIQADADTRLRIAVIGAVIWLAISVVRIRAAIIGIILIIAAIIVTVIVVAVVGIASIVIARIVVAVAIILIVMGVVIAAPCDGDTGKTANDRAYGGAF